MPTAPTVTETAPTDAPELTPSRKGSASTLRTIAWITAPVAARAAPTRAASSTRGVRTCQMIWYDETSSRGIVPPLRACHR